MNFAVIVAAGSSSRMRGVDKILLKINRYPLIYWTLGCFEQSKSVNSIILVVKKSDIRLFNRLVKNWACRKIASIIPGGDNRQSSVINGIKAASRISTRRQDIVIVHDGARPLVKPQLLESVILSAKQFGAAAAAVRSQDTLKMVDSDLMVIKTIERENIWLSQTPQAATLKNFIRAIKLSQEKHATATDEAGLFEHAKIPVKVVEGDRSNIKVTTRNDLEIVKRIAQ